MFAFAGFKPCRKPPKNDPNCASSILFAAKKLDSNAFFLGILLLSTVEVWAAIDGDSSQVEAYAKTQVDKPRIESLPHRLKFISAKIKEQIQEKDRPKWGVHFFHGVLHGRPQKSVGMPGIPCETSSLYKDTTIQAQLGQAKQDEIKEVRQQRLVEKKMAHSLVFHVVLTIDVRPDGEVALNITADKPRPNAARAQQQSDKIAQLKAVKKKLRATTLDTWVATAQTSGSVLKLSLFHTIAPSIRVSLLSFHRLIFLLWKAAKNLDKAPPSGCARARHLRPAAAAALPLPRHRHLHLQAAAAPPPQPPREQRGRRLPRLIPNRKEASFN